MTSRKANQARFVGVAAWLFRKRWVAGFLGLVAFCPPAWAQIPSLPGAGAGAGAGGAATSALGAGAGAGTPAAAPTTLWSRLGLSSSNLQACRDKLCSCQIGQMFNSLLSGPVGAISGGFICPLCPPAPSPAQIAALDKSRTVARKRQQPRSRRAKPMPRHASRRSSISAPLTAIAIPRQRKGFWPHSGRIPTSASALPPPGR